MGRWRSQGKRTNREENKGLAAGLGNFTPTDFQGVSEAAPKPKQPKKGNAVAGVGARNGADRKGSAKRTGRKNTVQRAPLTSALVAVLDREGMVCGVFCSRTAARSFLQGGWA